MLQKKMTIKSNLLNSVLSLLSVSLMIAFTVVFCSAIQSTLQQRSEHLANLSHRIFNRIDNLRFVSSQIVNELTEVTTNNTPFMKSTALQAKIDYINKPAGKTEAVIFGSQDKTSIKTAQRIAHYFDTLWGGMCDTWVMYYLNGQDKSLTLVSTLPLNALFSEKNNAAITDIISSKRAEMLQQANLPDKGESFSPLQHFDNLNRDGFFSMRTTYNPPDRLATVLAFDVPIKDLVSKSLDINHLQFRSEENPNTSVANDKFSVTAWQFNPSSFAVDLIAPIPSNTSSLVYPIPLGNLLKDAFAVAYLPLILLLLLNLGLFYARVLYRQLNYDNLTKLNEVQPYVLHNLSREIIQTLPYGFAIYDLRENQLVLMNDRAETLLLGLNLKNLISLPDEEEEIFHLSIDNENFVIRQCRSQIVPTYCLLFISEPDKEQMINLRLHKAQQLLEYNQNLRKQLFKSLEHCLVQPLESVESHLLKLAPCPLNKTWQDLLSSHQKFTQLVHNIFLLNAIEGNALYFNKAPFLLQTLVDEQITSLQNQLNERNIQLLVHHDYSSNHQYVGEAELLAKLLTLLLDNSLKSIEWGKITLQILIDSIQPERISIVLIDTSSGLSELELKSQVFPFNHDVVTNQHNYTHALDLFLASKLAEYFQGNLKIQTIKDIGTRYELTLLLPIPDKTEPEQAVLQGITVFIEVIAEETRSIVTRHFENLGANYVISETDNSNKRYDFMVTDDPDKLKGWGLLLSGNSVRHSLPSTQFSANFNIFQSVKDTAIKLIEHKNATENMEDTVEEKNNAIWMQSEYFQIFGSTVPDDINKLYSEITQQDFTSLALTAHRLKGVFAMLNLEHGRILCEQLEHESQQINDVNIKKMASELDLYVRTLLQQGRK